MIAQLTSHLWQSTFFALAAGLLTLAFRKNRAQIRYWLWLSASLKFFIPFSLLMSLGSHMEWAPAAHRIATNIAEQISTPAISYTIEQFSQPVVPASSPAPAAVNWMPIIGFVWLCGFMAIALMRSRSWLRIRGAVRASTPTNIGAKVEVRFSPGLLEPGVVGFLRPVLLLPEGIVERLTPSELEAVLAHELCHIRRRDNLFAAIHMIVEATFWFHPLVWWIGARLVNERERACDEEVITQGNQPDVYADAILNVCKLYAESPLACVSGVTGASIKQRIKAIMTNPVGQSLTRAKKTLLAGAGALTLATPVVIGLVMGLGNTPAIRAQSPAPHPTQSAAPSAPPVQMVQTQAPAPRTPATPVAPTLKFDAATVKPCNPADETSPGGGRGGGPGPGPRVSPGRLHIVCKPLSDLINTAYVQFADNRPINAVDGAFGQQEDGRVRGGPDWVRSDKYTIEASTDDPVANGPTVGPTPATARLLGPMLRALLENRFQLKFEVDVEDVSMYALTVAPGGFKLKPAEAGSCLSRDDPRPMPRGYDPGAKFVCGGGLLMSHGGNRTIQMNSTLGRFATMLQLDRQVVDKTGITGDFNISVEFSPTDWVPGPAPGRGPLPVDPPAQNETADVPPAPSIFTVLEKQLGLKLEPVKAPRGHIVIDRAERPSEN